MEKAETSGEARRMLQGIISVMQNLGMLSMIRKGGFAMRQRFSRSVIWLSIQRIGVAAGALTSLIAGMLAWGLMLGGAGFTRGAEPDRTPPMNVLLILADDLGARDLAVDGSYFHETPNLDGLAMSGMRFTRGYAACQVCSPSRASILTGQFPARHGITDWIGAASGEQWIRNDRLLPADYVRALPASTQSLAEVAKSNGYRTFFAGKWHLGGEGSLPTDHGFDFNLGGYHSGSPRGGYFSPYNNPQLEDGPDGECLPIRLADETNRFIEQSNNQPFFAMLSFYSVHGPIETTQERWRKYRNKAMALKSRMTSLPRFVIDRTMPVRQFQDNPIYAGVVEAMDDAVGKVLRQLESSGLAENTIVIFTSDNGGVASGDAFATSNLPLRGGKGRQWEGGIRVPLYMRVPGVTRPESTSDLNVSGVDLYPTLVQLLDWETEAGQAMDGVDLSKTISGESSEEIRNRSLVWHYPHYGNQGGEPSSILMQGDWKLIHYYEDGHDELYNLSSDEAEKKNLYDQNRERAVQMRKELDHFLNDVQAKRPENDPRFEQERWQKKMDRYREKTLPQVNQQADRFLESDFQPNKDWWGSSSSNK